MRYFYETLRYFSFGSAFSESSEPDETLLLRNFFFGSASSESLLLEPDESSLEDEDFLFLDLGSKGKRRLKQNAVPLYNLPCTDKTRRLINNKNNDREARKLRRDKRRNELFPTDLSNHQNLDVSEDLHTNNMTDEPDDQDANSFINSVEATSLLKESNEISATKRLVDIGVQVKSGDLITNFCDIIKTEMELNTLTGIINFDVLNVITDVVKDGFPKYRLEMMQLRRFPINCSKSFSQHSLNGRKGCSERLCRIDDEDECEIKLWMSIESKHNNMIKESEILMK
ncbi:hypothetical protein KQX54_014594 [Cotesia glomerata]|uniref:Uncharacterized protein n=1 Tax=Cotesia glomerata TaxID=32391 RepID=A0AAV7HU42_COTGL|nr:hypothetical protein KQX54_014594 [Cotesia glomerata]